jgi:predicted anti-sigma-YlaC factor YlaD
MRCLSIEQIYLYLEKELSPAEEREIHEHLAACPKCKKAAEERRVLLQAAESLPLWKTPPDFAQQVMARIFPERVSPLAWLGAAASGFASMILAIVIFALVTGQSLSNLLFNIYHTGLDFVKNLSPLFAKILKVASLLVKILQQLGELLIKGLTLLTTIISPQVQIILIAVAIIFIASSIYGIKRKLLIGEKI